MGSDGISSIYFPSGTTKTILQHCFTFCFILYFILILCVDAVMVVGLSPTTYGMRNDPAETSPLIMKKFGVEGKERRRKNIFGTKETMYF